MSLKRRTPRIAPAAPSPTDHEHFMRLAIGKAREGIRKGQTPFGACIVKEGRVISCEHNVVWRTTDSTAHAEVHAIRTACAALGTIDLSGCVIYSTCEPCPMCFAACHWAKISAIYFGARIRDAEQAGFHELSISNEQMKTIGGSTVTLVGDFLRSEAVELFTIWLNTSRHKTY